jgi:hypothetical protein
VRARDAVRVGLMRIAWLNMLRGDRGKAGGSVRRRLGTDSECGLAIECEGWGGGGARSEERRGGGVE